MTPKWDNLNSPHRFAGLLRYNHGAITTETYLGKNDVKKPIRLAAQKDKYIFLLHAIWMRRCSAQDQLIKTKLGNYIHKFNSSWNSRWTYTMCASITTDVSNYGAHGYGDPSHSMKALTWQGKNSVKVGKSFCTSRPSFQSLEIISFSCSYTLL